MTTFYAVRWIAQIPTRLLGYRVRFVACASQDAAEYRRDQEVRHGFPAEVLEVSADDWSHIREGNWNTFKPTPGL